nr:hypothetical protein [Tanacetum cinerariifolium]
PACHPSVVSCLPSLRESLPSVLDTYEYPTPVAASDVHGAETRVHIPAHGGSEAQNGPPDSILLSQPTPLMQHRPPPLQSVSAYKSCVSCSWSSASSVTLVLTSPKVIVELSPTTYLKPRADKHNLLRGGSSDSRVSSLRSTCGGIYRDGISGGSGDNDDGSNGDGIGDGDECTDGAVHLARRSPAEGGNSEVSGDGGRVGTARSLSTSASSGRGGETSSTVGITTTESTGAMCFSSSSSSLSLPSSLDESPSSSSLSSLYPWDSQLDHPLSH